MRETFHLVPREVWEAADPDAPYEPPSLAWEGFIHCTDGVGPLGVTFDRYYAADPRPFLALTIDLDALDVPWRYDAQGSPYPHIYGTVARGAILSVEAIARDEEGRFYSLASF